MEILRIIIMCLGSLFFGCGICQTINKSKIKNRIKELDQSYYLPGTFPLFDEIEESKKEAVINELKKLLK